MQRTFTAFKHKTMLANPVRFFDLHEYHSKKLMASFGINV
jgi:hypothetical protein